MSPDPAPSIPETNSDAALLALRPQVAAALENSETGTVGHFLHATLRPVLKLQNERLLGAVADFVLDHHMSLSSASAIDRQRMLAELLSRNTKLRYTVVGLVSGMFTAAEYGLYRAHRGEINRRMLELAQRRVLDQVERVLELAANAPAE